MPSSGVRHAALRGRPTRRLTAREADRRAHMGSDGQPSVCQADTRAACGCRRPSNGDPAPKVMPDCNAIYVVRLACDGRANLFCNARLGREYRFGQGLMIRQQVGRRAHEPSRAAHRSCGIADLSEKFLPDTPVQVAADPSEHHTTVDPNPDGDAIHPEIDVLPAWPGQACSAHRPRSGSQLPPSLSVQNAIM
jgi:hypothetical protein